MTLAATDRPSARLPRPAAGSVNETPDDVFLRFAAQKGLLDEEQIETLRGLQALDRMLGARRNLATLAVKEGLLTREAVAGLLRGVRYYFVRLHDRCYGRLAVKCGYIDRRALRHALAEQKFVLRERRVLPRLAQLLLDSGRLTPAQDRALRAELSPEPLA